MAINRYVSPSVSIYNPLSMDELAFAPSFLRQRHDVAAEQLSGLGIQAGQYDVLNDYQNVAGQLVDPLQRGIDELATNLATQGVNRSNAVPQALKLRSQYANLFGQSGGIGQLENATKQYRAQAQQIQEFFKDAPELAQYITSQLRPGEATLQDGKVQLGQMNTPSYVKDIPEAEILKSLNDAASKIKPSDLGDLGITSRQGVNDFDQIVTLASQKGVKAQQAFDLITNLVGQEQLNSLYQRGRMQGLTPEQTKDNFLSKVKNIAVNNAYVETDLDRMKFTDELALDAAKNMASASTDDLFAIPGGRIEAANVNPFKNLTTKNGVLESKEVPFDSGPYGRTGSGAGVTPQGGFQLGPDGKIIRPTQQSIKTEKTQAMIEFEELKRSTPELAGLTDKEALDKVNSYYENITQRYGAVVAPNPQQAKYLADNILNSLHTRSVYGPNGVGGTQEGLYESLGYEDVRDFQKEGEPYLLGMRKMGPNGSTVYEFGVTDKKGNKTSFYTSADELTNAYTSRSSDLGTMVMSGVSISPSYKMVQSDQGDPALSIDINPIGTSSDPYKLYLTTPGDAFGSTPEEQFEHIRQTLKGKNASEARKILTKQYNIPEEAFKVETMSDIAKEEDKLILNNLGSYWSNKQR